MISRIRQTLGIAGLLIAILALTASDASAAEPTMTIDPHPTMGYGTATVTGEVDPNGHEVRVGAQFRVAGSAEAWSELPSGSAIPGNAGPTPVSARVVGLTANTEYEFRLAGFQDEKFFRRIISSPPNPTGTTKPVTAPTVTIEPITTFTARTAQVSGHINPNAPEAAPTTEEVERGFAVNWHFECRPECPQSSERLEADDTSHEVHAELHITPGVTNEIFLVAENAGGEATRSVAGPKSISTPTVTPEITSASAVEVNTNDATIAAKIIPGGANTSYNVEYGPTAAYGSSTPLVGPVGVADVEHEVAVRIQGLAPATTYHWRLVATNGIATVQTADQVLRTFESIPTGGLPDGRAYEQVTSLDKGGANIAGAKSAELVSPDGDANLYYTNPTLPGSEGAQDYGSYLATRGADAWNNQGLLPPAWIGRDGRLKAVDEDLNRSYVTSFNPELPFSQASRFYERDNATRQLTEIAPGPVVVADSTPDGSKLLFESHKELAPGSEAGTENVFLWDASDHTLHLADATNQGVQFEEGAYAGPLYGAGSYKVAAEALSSDGEDVIFTSIHDSQLYLRRNVLAPQSALNGQEECTEPTKACTVEISASRASTPDPNGPQTPLLWNVANGGVPIAFFTSAGKLTADATTGPSDEGRDLYRYDAESEELADLTPDHNVSDPSGAVVVGVLGVSEDGKHAYFAANGVLGDGGAKGATPGNCRSEGGIGAAGEECNLYLWSESGGISYIGRLDAEGEPGVQADSGNWLRNSFYEEEKTSRVSRSGDSLVFRSQNPQTAEPTGGVPQFYRYDADNGSIQCLTCAASGAAQPGRPTLYSYEVGAGGAFAVLQWSNNYSADGDRFIFQSGARLVPADTNGIGGCPTITVLSSVKTPKCQDVYEWEAKGTGGCERDQNGGCLYLLSTGTDSAPVFFDGADRTGDNAFIYTNQQLVGQDRDQLVDIYDARVGGGLASQNPSPPNPCSSSESCRGPATASAVEATPGTVTFSAAPEVGGSGSTRSRKVKCRPGFKQAKRNGKAVCVKKGGSRHHQKKAHHKSGGAK